MELECLRTVIQSGPTSYPLYIGFASADAISQVAEAPAFTSTTPNASIAANVLTPPVAEWQRPLIDSSIAAIKSTFGNSGKLMPNPVLLAKNPQSDTPVSPKQQKVGGVTPTNIWSIDVSDPGTGQPKPLWILDGQHRIMGLKDSAQHGNHIPFVLLLNEDSTSYSEASLAEIFAQVTTTAASLDPLHNEWMSFAFKLGKYATGSKSDPAVQRSAMEASALMCKLPNINSEGLANPFRDRIKFNPKKPPDTFPGGFAYDCMDMQKLLARAYFAAALVPGVARLSAEDVACQMGLAYIALQRAVKAPQNLTVFFGDKDSTQRIMQDAFIVGVCARLLQYALPIDWLGLLEELRFNTSNWNFKTWVRSVSGTDQTVSKGIAEKLFRTAFTTGSLTGQADLVEILRGDGAQFEVEIEGVKANGRVDPATKASRTLSKGSALGLAGNAGVKRRLKIMRPTDNIGSIEPIDSGESTTVRRVRLPQLKRSGGLILDPGADPADLKKNPLSIQFIVQMYGGNQITADLDVDWQ